MSLVLEVPLDRLRTSLAPLRGERTDRQSDLSAMPLRVAAADEGAFEVLDGFKRLSQWRAEGRREVPVVVEPVSGIARKARILAANSPRKTTSGMDEASPPPRSRSCWDERRPGSSDGSSWRAASLLNCASGSTAAASPSPWQ